MVQYYEYNPFSTERLAESVTVRDGKVMLRHIPKEASIQIAGFDETDAVHILPNQFRCDYALDSFYRDSSRVIYFNTVHNGTTLNVSYIAIGTVFTAEDANEIKAHLENSSLHGGTLKTMSTTVKGGAKVGNGLVMNGEKLNVNIGEGLEFGGDGRINVIAQPDEPMTGYAYIGSMSHFDEARDAGRHHNNVIFFATGDYDGYEGWAENERGFYILRDGEWHRLDLISAHCSLYPKLTYGGAIDARTDLSTLTDVEIGNPDATGHFYSYYAIFEVIHNRVEYMLNDESIFFDVPAIGLLQYSQTKRVSAQDVIDMPDEEIFIHNPTKAVPLPQETIKAGEVLDLTPEQILARKLAEPDANRQRRENWKKFKATMKTVPTNDVNGTRLPNVKDSVKLPVDVINFAGIGSEFPKWARECSLFIKNGVGYLYLNGDWQSLRGDDND